MNITREDIGTLQAILTLEVEPTDYKDRLKKAAIKLGKELNIKGFRKGKVPRPVVIKMFGKRLLIQELNDILSESLDNYLKENNIELIGRPIPQQDELMDLDMKVDKNYTFNYELGLKPEFELPLTSTSIVQYDIQISDEQVQKEIDLLQKRNGTLEVTEEAIEEGDVLGITLQELNEDGTEKADGWYNETSISLDMLKEESRGKLIGEVVENSVSINVFEAFDREEADVKKHILNLPEEEAETNILPNFLLTINKVQRNVLHPINQELFDIAMGEGKIDSEEAFKEEIRKGIGHSYKMASEQKLANDLMKTLIEDTEMALPHDFLKKMLDKPEEEAAEENTEEENTEELAPEVEKTEEVGAAATDDEEDRLEKFTRSIKWMLIRNKILTDDDIKIDDQEVFSHAVQEASMRLGGVGGNNPQMHSYVENLVTNLMKQDPNYRNRKIDEVVQHKAITALKDKVSIDLTPVSVEEFSEIQKN